MLHIAGLINRIRNSNDIVKKKWLVAMSSAAMTVIVGVWATYMNYNMHGFDPHTQEITETRTDGASGFGATLSNGLKAVKHAAGLKISRITASFASLAQKKNSVSIKSASMNFIAEGIEGIKPATLPR